MAAALLLATGFTAGPAFPAEPIRSQVVVGAELAHAAPNLSLSDPVRSPEPRSGLGRIWKSDRKPVGWWSNGYEKKSVEHVTWLSPELISRWLGFLEAREFWRKDELQIRRRDELATEKLAPILNIKRLERNRTVKRPPRKSRRVVFGIPSL